MIRSYKEKRPQIAADAFVAENASIIGEVVVKNEASIWYNVVVRGDENRIEIGPRTNIQDATVIHISHEHPTLIGADVTIGHRAIVHGCTVEDRCLIGMGAIILDGAHIEEECIIGAGALVTQGKRIPKHSMVLGSPAKVVRTLTEEEIQGLKRAAEGYVRLSKQY